MTQDEIKQAWEESTGSCWPDEGCFTAGEYDRHILAFVQLVRNATLEEASAECTRVEEYFGSLDATQCARMIRSMKP